jgi:hypothetical protein
MQGMYSVTATAMPIAARVTGRNILLSFTEPGSDYAAPTFSHLPDFADFSTASVT